MATQVISTKSLTSSTIRRGDKANELITTLKEIGVTLGQGFHFGEAVREISTKIDIRRKDFQGTEVKRSSTLTIPPSTIPLSVKTAYNFNSLDIRVKCQIQEIGECQFWNLLKRLLPKAEGIVTYMQPGRSGAYVFKVLAKFRKEDRSKTRPKAWIIKLANEKKLLELEVKNHTELIMTPLHRASYPKLLTSKPLFFGNLIGIAIELEEDASSLMEIFYTLSEKEMNVITDDIAVILKSMYGEPDKKIHILWKDFYNLNEMGWTKILSFFEENRNIIKGKVYDSERIQNFVRTKGESEKIINNFQIDADTRTVHGDFNSRNILVNKNNKVIIIDFSAVGQSHIAKDIAKLERDVVFRIFDAYSPYYYEWSRIKIWQHFSNLNKKGTIFPQKIFYSGNNIELANSKKA